MINKKIALLFTVLFLFPAFVHAGGKNFVSLLSGMVPTKSTAQSSSGNINKSFVGQSVVFKETFNNDIIARSGFASSILSSQNENIEINVVKPEDMSLVFDTHVISFTLKVIDHSGYNISKIKYQILVDSSTNTWEEKEFADITPAPTVDITESIAFSKDVNYIKFFANNDNPSEPGSFSPVYTIRLSSEAAYGDVKITLPDPLTKLATIDPQIQTTTFDIKYTTATVSLYKGNSAGGTPLYSVNISSTTDEYGIYNSTTSRIDFFNSTVLKGNLNNNTDYTLKIELWDTETESVIEVEKSPLTFKALSGGVADIIPYPSPFNPNKEKVKIRYLLAKDSKVTIKLYDKAGKIVCKLLDNVNRNAGTNEEEWDGRNYAGDTLATGAYIVEIIAKASNGEHRRYTALAIVGK